MKISMELKNTISICILAVVGAIFIFKYSIRIGGSAVIPYLMAAVYAVGYMAFYIVLGRFYFAQYPWAGDKGHFLAMLALLVFGVILIVAWSPAATAVTRLPAIKEWIERLLAGKFPWGVETRFNPSGFPFLFILALPFYYAGNIGYLEVVGLILFCIALINLYIQPRKMWLPIFALVLLPSFYYELLVRSELFFNMVLIIIPIILCERYLDIDRLNIRFFGLATLFGLGLSTRTVVGIIFTGYCVYKFRQQILHGAFFAGFSFMIFGLTLLPFLVWNAPKLFTEGPFSVQMAILPSSISMLFVIMATAVGWKAACLRDVLFGEGVLLALVAAIPFLATATQFGVSETVLKARFDISYFIFCTPFLLLSLEKPFQL
jgi:hypothetical protein